MSLLTIGRTTSVVAAGLSGVAVGSLAVGVVLAVVAVITLVLSAISTSRKNTHSYAEEIRTAEKRGGDDREREIRPWLEYYKSIAEGRGTPAIPPPRPPAPPTGGPDG